jgi:DNA/RNA endonuclease YhcR with UshA esterase domain
MKANTARILLLSCLLGLATALQPQQSSAQTIRAGDAKNHIGETATVCGKVASTRYAAGSRGQPTFLNLDEPYPRQIFTILIWGSDRPKFGEPEVTYRGKSVCVTGQIKEYRGVPEVVASEPEQIKVQPNKEK